MPRPQTFYTEGREDEDVPFLARIRGNSGALITQASLASVACKVISPRSGAVLAMPAVAVSSSVYDALQAGGQWEGDATGYNFLHVVPASAFPEPGVYLVEYTFTPVSGGPFTLHFHHAAAAKGSS